MPDAHKNFAGSLVATAPSPATSGTSLVVTTGDGTKFPAAPFNATIWPAGATPSTANAEIVRVTAVSTDTLTITRAQESTSARTVIVGDQIVASITAKTLTDVEASAQIFSGFYGDGSDGNVTITTTVTLTRDMFYDTLTINSPGVLKTANFRIYCKTACTVGSGATVSNDGPSATSSSGATATAVQTLGNSLGSGAAGSTATASGSSSANVAFGGAGGTGGAGSGTGSGAHGTANAAAANAGSIRSVPQAVLGFVQGGSSFAATVISAGTGGGGGGGDATNAGGGGGATGGVMVLNARTVSNSGTISANGGNGFSPTVGNVGGGGGGGGGVVIVNTSQAITGSAPVATGGTGGIKSGTGTNGSAGSAGNVFVNVWS